MGRVLIVDDEAHVTRLLKRFLISKSYDVCTASDGNLAIEKIRELSPDVVLLDIVMPGLNGIDTLKEIKKINPETAVIMITAISNEELAKKAIKLGAFDYLTKPINLDYLETCLFVKLCLLSGKPGPKAN